MSEIRPVVLLGDAQAQPFKMAANNHLFAPRRVAVSKMDGVKLAGAAAAFRDFIAKQDKRAFVVVQLGAADCAEAATLEDSMRDYVGFIDKLARADFADIVITGVAPGGGDAEPASRYNARLKEIASASGLSYVELAVDTPDKAEPIGASRAAALWATRLNAHFDAADPIEAPVRRYQAREPSMVKALPVPAAQLGPKLKTPVKVADILKAEVLAEREGHLILRQVTLNGLPLGPSLRTIFKQHWELHASVPPSSAAPQPAAPEPAAPEPAAPEPAAPEPAATAPTAAKAVVTEAGFSEPEQVAAEGGIELLAEPSAPEPAAPEPAAPEPAAAPALREPMVPQPSSRATSGWAPVGADERIAQAAPDLDTANETSDAAAPQPVPPRRSLLKKLTRFLGS